MGHLSKKYTRQKNSRPPRTKNQPPLRTIHADVLIIGSGAAGLRAAIEAHDHGAKVIVVGKCQRGDAHTILATGGINAALGTMDPKDTWRIHAADTLKEGWFLADYHTVELLCKNAPRAISDLVRYHVPFARDAKGKLIQRFFGAHTYRRTCFVGDETGKAILEGLVREAKKRKFPFFGSMYVASLIKTKGRVVGAVAFDMKTKKPMIFSANVTILATGGYSRIYRRSSSRDYENTGDGIALAYDAGAELQDMEMVQFHPTGMIWPRRTQGTLVTEAVRGEGGRLYNAQGDRFMAQYDKERMELGARDEVARAIYSEIMHNRGTRHGGVWLDITHRPLPYIKQRLPKMYRQFKAVGVDISKQHMEVAPTAHYSMGGIRVDFRTGQTSVPGLLAVGEASGGLHGANRLGGNSLAETIVFGTLTGRHAAKYRTKKSIPLNKTDINNTIQEITDRFSGAARPAVVKKQLQEIMWEHAGIVKHRRDLQSAQRSIKALQRKNLKGTDLFAALDATALLITADAVIQSSLVRKESRGAFFLADHPHPRKRYLAHIVCRKRGKGMQLRMVPVRKIKGPLATLLKKDTRKYYFLE